MSRSATRTGPGMPRSPFSQRRTVRKSLSSASAAACCVANPAAKRAALNSSGVMAGDDHAAVALPLAAGNQVPGDERAVRILDRVARQYGGQIVGGNVTFTSLSHFPAAAPVHLDNDVRHGRLRSNGWSTGPLARCVNGRIA